MFIINNNYNYNYNVIIQLFYRIYKIKTVSLKVSRLKCLAPVFVTKAVINNPVVTGRSIPPIRLYPLNIKRLMGIF